MGAYFIFKEIFMKMLRYFSPLEWGLWLASVLLILISFFAFHSSSLLNLTASLLGVTALIFTAKGNPLGPGLMIIFFLLYGLISYRSSYYGELLTYIGMCLPMAVLSLISWLRHPYQGRTSEVQIGSLRRAEAPFLVLGTLLVTFLFYFILKALHTPHLFPATVSVATSFVAAYLTFRRSPGYAVAYAANDIVLILLWVLAALEDPVYFSVVICFSAFFLNDMYCFFHWQQLRRQQAGA